jgi:hypothetical protein
MRDLDMDNEGDHRVTEKAPEMPDPEAIPVRVAHLRKVARRAIEAAGVEVGGDHLIAPIVAAIQAECSKVRDHAAIVVIAAQEQGAKLVDPRMPEGVDGLQVLAFNVRQHVIEQNGTITVLTPEDG